MNIERKAACRSLGIRNSWPGIGELTTKPNLPTLTKTSGNAFIIKSLFAGTMPNESITWITGHAAEELGISDQAVESINDLLDGLQTKLREDLALICRSHHFNDLDDLSTYVIRRA